MGKSNRKTEGILLLLASIILLLGFVLTFGAKLPAMRDVGVVDINTASSDDIASALRIDRSLANIIVNYRKTHGPFAATADICSVRLLSPDQAASLIEISHGTDITAITPGQLVARLRVGNAVAERLVAVFADWNRGKKISASKIHRIPVVDGDVLTRFDSHIRVRNPGVVVRVFWIYVTLFLSVFVFFHAVLRRKAPNADPIILPCVMMLAGLGAIALFSIKDPIRDSFAFQYQVQGIILSIGFALIPLTARFRSAPLHRYTYAYAFAAVGLMLLLVIFGEGPGNAKLRLFGFQPIELIKLIMIFFAASYLADRWGTLMDQTGPKRPMGLPRLSDIGPLAVMYFTSLSLFLLVKDMGPMPLLFGAFIVMLYAATGKKSIVWSGVILVFLTGFVAYRMGLRIFDVRVDMWLHPWRNTHPNGMQLGQGLWGMATGGIWGSGAGLGFPATMPGVANDLIFAAIAEEFGLIGSIGALVLWSILLARGFRIALRARSDFARFLAIGVTSLLGVQTVLIVFGVLGLLPLTGITLPFVSFGKSSLVVSYFIMGLLLAISSDAKSDSMLVRREMRNAVRGVATGLIVLLLGVAGIGRLVWIQGIKSDRYAGMMINTPDADGIVRAHVNPRLMQVEASIPRGSIYDRNGRVLATSKSSELEELGLTHAAADRPDKRLYPYGGSLVHIIGYVDPRCGGPIGLEGSENGVLRGFNDYSELLPVYRRRYTFQRQGIRGKDIRLTIDSELQAAVERALREKAGAVRDRRTGEPKHKGAAVVLDVKTGEILAAVSIPNFNPNELALGVWKQYNVDRTKEAVLFDRARQSAYTPGSVFKLVTASAALENGVDFVYNCRHLEHNVVWRRDEKRYSRARITDFEDMHAHGATGLAKAIRVSCNIFFAHLGLELGPDRLYDMAHKYHLRRIAPPNKLAEDLPDNAYGQGSIQVSPLEMARIVAAIANDGVMMKPHLIKEVDLNGKVLKTVASEEMGHPISPESAKALRAAMADVVKNGTARGVFDGTGVSVAGKTGSAQNDQADGMPHSWFVGFAPVDNPKIAFAVIVENGGYGRSAAGSVCLEIVKSALHE